MFNTSADIQYTNLQSLIYFAYLHYKDSTFDQRGRIEKCIWR